MFHAQMFAGAIKRTGLAHFNHKSTARRPHYKPSAAICVEFFRRSFKKRKAAGRKQQSPLLMMYVLPWRLRIETTVNL